MATVDTVFKDQLQNAAALTKAVIERNSRWNQGVQKKSVIMKKAEELLALILAVQTAGVVLKPSIVSDPPPNSDDPDILFQFISDQSNILRNRFSPKIMAYDGFIKSVTMSNLAKSLYEFPNQLKTSDLTLENVLLILLALDEFIPVTLYDTTNVNNDAYITPIIRTAVERIVIPSEVKTYMATYKDRIKQKMVEFAGKIADIRSGKKNNFLGQIYSSFISEKKHVKMTAQITNNFITNVVTLGNTSQKMIDGKRLFLGKDIAADLLRNHIKTFTINNTQNILSTTNSTDFITNIRALLATNNITSFLIEPLLLASWQSFYGYAKTLFFFILDVRHLGRLIVPYAKVTINNSTYIYKGRTVVTIIHRTDSYVLLSNTDKVVISYDNYDVWYMRAGPENNGYYGLSTIYYRELRGESTDYFTKEEIMDIIERDRIAFEAREDLPLVTDSFITRNKFATFDTDFETLLSSIGNQVNTLLEAVADENLFYVETFIKAKNVGDIETAKVDAAALLAEKQRLGVDPAIIANVQAIVDALNGSGEAAPRMPKRKPAAVAAVTAEAAAVTAEAAATAEAKRNEEAAAAEEAKRNEEAVAAAAEQKRKDEEAEQKRKDEEAEQKRKDEEAAAVVAVAGSGNSSTSVAAAVPSEAVTKLQESYNDAKAAVEEKKKELYEAKLGSATKEKIAMLQKQLTNLTTVQSSAGRLLNATKIRGNQVKTALNAATTLKALKKPTKGGRRTDRRTRKNPRTI